MLLCSSHYRLLSFHEKPEHLVNGPQLAVDR